MLLGVRSMPPSFTIILRIKKKKGDGSECTIPTKPINKDLSTFFCVPESGTERSNKMKKNWKQWVKVAAVATIDNASWNFLLK